MRKFCLFTCFVSLLAAADPRAVAEAAFDEMVRSDFTALAQRFSAAMRAAGAEQQISAAMKSLGPILSPRPEPRVSKVQIYDVFVFSAEFQAAKLNVVIAIDGEGRIAGLRLQPPAPEPAKPGELLVASGDLKLPATLALPEGSGPFPAVVLVHGSGPQDRDETVGANTPFKDIAEGLAKRGIATLRYVKRTKQYPQSAVVTVKEEVIDDALSALALARRQSRVDPKRVFLLGHSLGGYIAPRIAQGDPAVAGVVLLAANARSIEVLAGEQIQYLGAPPEVLSKLKQAAPPSYWKDLESYDPVASARQIAKPFLILQGERDYQVTMKDFGLWQAGLKDRKDVSFKSYPKLNHLFLEGEGKSLPAEYSRPGQIPVYVLDDIAAFIRGLSGH